MARTRAEDFGDKLQFILDTAADLFADRGFANTSINDIAAACRMSKSALYHYHRSKDAILYALLATHVRKLLSDAEDAVDGVKDPEQRLCRFITSLMENYAQARGKHIVLLNETGSLSAVQQHEIRHLGQQLVAFAVDILTPLNPELMAQPGLRKPYAMMFYGLVNWTYTWYDASGPLQPDELSARMADLFLAGFPNLAVSPLRRMREIAKT